MHWHLNPMLNASMLTAQSAMRVYMFHNCQFHALVMGPFFHPHEPYDDVTLDDVCPPFHPPMYRIDGESNSDTCLTPTYSIESNPLESSYPSVIQLTSDSSSFFAGLALTPIHR